MVAPVTGPFVDVKETKGPPNKYGFRPTWTYVRRQWYRQKRPYDRPLGFSNETRKVLWHGSPHEYSLEYQNIWLNPNTSRYVDRVYRSAYARFLDKSRSSASELLTAFCERRKSADMIGTAALRLTAGFIAAKRGDLPGIIRAWGRGGIRKKLRDAGGHVLEYSFGWAPFIADIANAVDVLDHGTMDSGRVFQRSRFLDSLYYDAGAVGQKVAWRTEVGMQIGWELRVDHPSIALLNQLGLVNPVQTAWELVPFSFVIDYFVNVNDVIGSMTALAGCSMSNEYTTSFIKDNIQLRAFWETQSPPGYPPPSYGAERVSVTRTLAVPRPSLGRRAPWNMSWARAATSVSLLLQQLKG